MLEILKARFQDNKNLHMELSWPDVEKRLLEHPGSMDVLRRMEESGRMIFATRAVHCSENDITERFSHFITGRIRTIPCAGSEVIF